MSARNNKGDADIRSGGAAHADALSAYLRTVGDLPPLSVAEQNELWRDIDEATAEVRHRLFRFGFRCLLDGILTPDDTPQADK